MKMKNLNRAAGATLLLLSIGMAAHASTLTIGDKAPAIKVGGWVKGSPVAKFDAKKLYVVEFWATWCGPCKESIPHLTQLAHEFGPKVSFTGVSAFESQSSKTDTSYIGKVNEFVKGMGAKMDYNVAYDTPAGDMATTWMRAAAQPGIPTAFVVKDGQIAWIGHPMGGLEDALKQMVAGTYDEKAFGAKFKHDQQAQAEEQMLSSQIQTLMQNKKFADAVKLIDSEIQKDPSAEDNLAPEKMMALFAYDPTAGSAYVEKMGKTQPQFFSMAAQILGRGNGDVIMPDLTNAEKFAREGITAQNGSWYSEYSLGVVLDQKKDYKNAAAAYQTAIDAAKKSGAANADQIAAALQKSIDSDNQLAQKGDGVVKN